MAAFRAHKKPHHHHPAAPFITMPEMPVLSPTAWSTSDELRWPSSGSSLHWQAADGRQTLRETVILLSVPGNNKLQRIWTGPGPRETLSLIAFISFKICWQKWFLLASAACLDQVFLDCILSQGMWMKTFQNYSITKLSVALWTFRKEKSERNECILHYENVIVDNTSIHGCMPI